MQGRFRGFDLMKDPDGFRTFWESLALDPCLDPIHSSGLRKFLSENDAVYEEVNKQSLSRNLTIAVACSSSPKMMN